MYCRNCGKEVEENTKFCGYCGTNVILPETPNNQPEPEVEISEEEKKSQKEAIIAALIGAFLFFCPIILDNSNIGMITIPFGIIILIYSRVKAPKNPVTKAISTVAFGIMIFAIICFILFIIACASCLSSMPKDCG